MKLYRIIAVITQFDEVLANFVTEWSYTKEEAENKLTDYINTKYDKINSIDVEVNFESVSL
jgi:predicted GTPase